MSNQKNTLAKFENKLAQKPYEANRVIGRLRVSIWWGTFLRIWAGNFAKIDLVKVGRGHLWAVDLDSLGLQSGGDGVTWFVMLL